MRTLDKRLNARIAPTLARRAPTLTLAWEARCKSRQPVTLDTGEAAALVLPRGAALRDGDLLVADDGGLVRVIAAAEAVLRARTDDPLTLARAAYHLGNRHTPVEIGPGYLQLEADPVLEDLLLRLGLTVERVSQPFQPEPGAYGGGHRHGHEASFEQDYALAQQVFHEHHGHDHGHDHDGDAHGCGCGCSHDHGHAHGHDHDHGRPHEAH